MYKRQDYGQQEAIAKFGFDPRVYQTTVKEFYKNEAGQVCGALISKLKSEVVDGRRQMVPTGEEFTVDCDLVLMDEIGRMERHADTYSARIRTLLDGCVPILGVVQKKADTPLAAAIRSHPNVRLIEVSEENRDVLLPEILSALRS